MPVGTVMVKSFLFDGKLVETRLFVHFDATTWVGYTYQWDEAQTDATIVADERVDGSVQHRPADGHVAHPEPHGLHDLPHGRRRAPRWVPTTAQMNRVVNGMNQIDRIKAMNRFEPSSPATPYKTALREPDGHDRDRGGARALLSGRELRLLPPARRRELPEPRSSQ